jgi:hypothetical protein
MNIALASLALSGCAHHAASSTAPAAGGGVTDPVDSYRAAYMADDAQSYRGALETHRGYLADHGSEPKAREVRMRYAKLLFGLGQLDAAAAEFERVAASSTNPNDYLARMAARNVVVCRHQARADQPAKELYSLKSFGGIDQAALNLEWEPITLPEAAREAHEQKMPAPEQKLADACDAYFARAEPTDPALLTIRLASAEIYFRFDHRLEGVKRCDDIVTRWPQVDASGLCVRTTINALNSSGQWKELESHVRSKRTSA